jgi:hypothetical protein
MRRYLLGWILITVLAPQALPQTADEVHSTTRFGTLTLDKDNYVQFKSRRLSPAMQANNSIELSDPYRIGTSDVVLVTIIGGTACPYLYHFVTVTKDRATATRAFGTCNEAEDVQRVGVSMVVKMHGFRGPFEPEASRRKALAQLHTFVFKNGVITKDGAVVK